jgi:Holliday junction resolvase-like predicted endonuclease
VIGRNVRVRMGEADLVCVAPDRRTIVVVEVKSRRVGEAERDEQPGRAQPAPERSVHWEKRRKLRAIARHLGRANGWTGRPLRIDVVAIEWPEGSGSRGAKPVLRHHEGVMRVW